MSLYCRTHVQLPTLLTSHWDNPLHSYDVLSHGIVWCHRLKKKLCAACRSAGQGSTSVYSRKVEHVYQLVLRTIDFLTQQKSRESANAHNAESGDDNDAGGEVGCVRGVH